MKISLKPWKRSIPSIVEPIEEIPFRVLLDARLVGHPDAKRRRDRLSELLQIGQVNGKGLKKRLEMFRIGQHQLMEALKVLHEEDGHE